MDTQDEEDDSGDDGSYQSMKSNVSASASLSPQQSSLTPVSAAELQAELMQQDQEQEQENADADNDMVD